MSNTPIVYSSADASALQLTGQNGSLVALLDALLRTGYGAKSGCGWSAVSGNTGTLSAWRNSASTGSGFYIQCKDNSDGTGGAKEAQMRGFETMSDASTGSGDFPSVAQLSTGVIFHKSSAASGTARAWWAVGCERWLYLYVDSYGDGGGGMYFFGDLVSIRPGDAAQFAVIGGAISNQSASSSRTRLGFAAALSTGAADGAYIARNYAQVPGGVLVTCTNSIYGAWTAGVLAYPFEVNNGIAAERAWLHEAINRPRARLPGCYVSLHTVGAMPADLTALTGVPGMPGSTTWVVKFFRHGQANASGNAQFLFFDITNAD